MTFETLLSNPAVQALGMALLHFVWQGLLLALFLWLFLALAPAASAQLRYAVGSAVLLAMPAMLILTSVFRDHPPPSFASPAYSPAVSDSRPFSAPGTPSNNIASLNSETRSVGPAGWAVGLWLVGILALSLHSATGWARAQRLKYRGTAAPEPHWSDVLEQLMRQLEISRPIRLCTSVIAEVPMVVGWMRPLILLPVSALSGLSPREIEAILAHELAHIRRHDYLANLLQTAIETLLFYHPAVWWVSRQVRREREHCCDDIAVRMCGDVKLYAGALAQLEELRARNFEPALAATGGELLGRIRRLLKPTTSGKKTPRFLGTIAAVVVLGSIGVPAMLLLNAEPQQAARPVVSASVPPAAPKSESAPALERRMKIAGDVRVAFQDAEHLFKGIQIDAGNRLIAEPNRTPSEAGTDALIKLYDSSKDPDVKQSALNYLGERDSAKAVAKLRSVAQSDADPDMRRQAMGSLASHAKTYEELASLFDSTRDPEMRRTVLDYLAGSSDPRVLDKLLAIAQSDSDPDIRRGAVDYIGYR